jgi:hypothetical protein
MIVVVAFYPVDIRTIFPGARIFLSVKSVHCSNLVLCWAFLCDGTGAQSTAAKELRHSER